MEIKRRSEGMTVSSHEEETVCEGQEHEKMNVKGEADRDSNMLTVTFHCA